MELDKNIKQQLAELLADPSRAAANHSAMLNELLEEYPYYQPLHLLLAKANIGLAERDTLAKASLYTTGQVLHQFLFRKEVLKADFHVIGEIPVITEDVTADEALAIEEVDVVADEVQEIVSVPAEIDPADEQETFEEINELSLPPVENTAAADEEVFEEIAEVDLNNYRPFRNSDRTDEPVKTQEQEEVTARKNSLEDDFVFESIASSDFFAFQDKFSTEVPAQAEKEPFVVPVIEEHDEAAAAASENSRVSNYHDEKLPYTFLWWLAKTRKEHQSIFQPYALPKKENSQELQQQYVEHIFHLQSHLTGTEALLDPAEQTKPVTKDFEIIDSFIKNDPQIMPPHAEQIDNENKAKKSAEDQNDLVSETLANIYIEQMLYDKAIDTYEKLSLKFPEKRRYFADLIQSIEKKI